MPGQAAGVDLGGTKVQGVIADKAGNPLASAVASTPSDGGPASVVEQVAAVVRAAAANAGIGVEDLDGVGVGSAGTVRPDAGVVSWAGNLSGFDRPVPLAGQLARALGIAPTMVRLDNDVNAATLAEYRTGAGRGLDSLLAVFAGTGVGGAVVVEGRLHRGARGAAGELGHAVVVMDGEPCPCGRRGCAEAYVGRTPMERAVRAAVEAGRPTELPAIQRRLGRARLTTDVLAEGLAVADALAAELVELAARALGAAIGSACNLLDVRGVLLGGGLTDGLGDPFVRRVEREIRPRLLADDPPVEVRGTALGDMAGAIGASLLLQERASPS
ncbi:MAG TPA: ROK family protein [Actinomycetota bacterium]|jgi:glucokinase|nr:ROK family protein [Actinomycetota bacterium]